MNKSQHHCDVCGEPLDNPLAKARGHHHDCTEKDGGEEYMEK